MRVLRGGRREESRWRGDREAEGTRLLSGRSLTRNRGFESRPLRYVTVRGSACCRSPRRPPPALRSRSPPARESLRIELAGPQFWRSGRASSHSPSARASATPSCALRFETPSVSEGILSYAPAGPNGHRTPLAGPPLRHLSAHRPSSPPARTPPAVCASPRSRRRSHRSQRSRGRFSQPQTPLCRCPRTDR